MPIRTVPDTGQKYYLAAFDKNGEERHDDSSAPHGRLSEMVFEAVESEPVTDVILISHGWKGDVPAAIEQYDAWIGAMAACPEDAERIARVRPGFHPLIVGLHWPSLPWGDESLSSSGVSFAAPGESDFDPVASALDTIADSGPAREAIATIFAAANEALTPKRLPPDVVAAYEILAAEAGLSGRGPAGGPGDDAEPFDPQSLYLSQGEQEISFGAPGLGGVLSVLQQLSFWQMKKRARTFGEKAGAGLLRQLQRRAAEQVRFHMMGHSFGCIVASATVAGAGGNTPLPRPVDSLFLVQGALSLWSYCSDIPSRPGQTGYFHGVAKGGKVAGPMVTTQSSRDTAVGTLYPLAAGAAQQVSFAPGKLPAYGALGTFGAQGPGFAVEERDILGIRDAYGFQPGRIYNLESSKVICDGGGPSGAHNDIAKPEVAHAFWEAMMTLP